MIGLCTAPLLETTRPQTPASLAEDWRISEFLTVANDPIGIQRFTTVEEAPLEERLSNTFFRALYLVRERTRELSADHTDELLCQLSELLSVECWDDDDAMLNLASLRTMVDVIATLDRGVGALTIARNGNLVATWSADDHVLRVEAEPNGAVTWTSLHPRGAQPRHAHNPGDSINNLQAVARDLLGDADGHPQQR